MSEIIQGSPEWKALRCGKVTASRVADVVAKTKTGYSASRANYLAQLIAEHLTGTAAETYSNAAMQHGTETEPEARDAYCFYQGVTVEQVAFFVSYDPRMPEHMRLFIRRVPRDDKRINDLETEIASFLLEMAVKLSELNSIYGEKEAA
jgi:hypothetical protein